MHECLAQSNGLWAPRSVLHGYVYVLQQQSLLCPFARAVRALTQDKHLTQSAGVLQGASLS